MLRARQEMNRQEVKEVLRTNGLQEAMQMRRASGLQEAKEMRRTSPRSRNAPAGVSRQQAEFLTATRRQNSRNAPNVHLGTARAVEIPHRIRQSA
jgi:hypothetical protein